MKEASSERPIRLIACDIDDTLLPFGEKTVSAENLKAIEEARAAGIYFILATGRLYVTAKNRVEQIAVPGEPVISSSGSDVRVNGRTVRLRPMDDDLVARIEQEFEKLGVRSYLFCGDETLCLPGSIDEHLFQSWTEESGGVNPVRVVSTLGELLEASKGSTQKMLAMVDDAELHKEIFAHICEKFEHEADIERGGGLNLEIIGKGVTKASGLEAVCEMLGVPVEETMAIGDSENDVGMLRAAGLGVAVANAMPAAREAADAVVRASAEDGVAQAIREFALSRKRPGGNVKSANCPD